MDIYVKYLEGNISTEELLLEFERTKYWILPDGQIKNIDSATDHGIYLMDNFSEFNLTAGSSQADAYEAGAIRVASQGDELIIEFTDGISREAFKSLQNFATKFELIRSTYSEYGEKGISPKDIEETTFRVEQFTKLRNRKALINRTKHGDNSITSRFR